MRHKFFIMTVLVICSFVLWGCGGSGGGADENKPLSEVKSEAATMDVSQLRDMAVKYKDAITAKSGELDVIVAKLKEIPLTEALGDEAKNLKAEVDELSKSISALKERFSVYYDKLKELKGDLSGLEI